MLRLQRHVAQAKERCKVTMLPFSSNSCSAQICWRTNVAVRNLFSYRKRLAAGSVPDVFQYDTLSDSLLVQIVHIWAEAIGPYVVLDFYELGTTVQNNRAWIEIEKCVSREHGLFRLGNENESNALTRCANYLRNSQSFDYSIDLIEVSFQYIDQNCRKFNAAEQQRRGITRSASGAIAELNERFRRAGVGYQFESGQIVRISSDFVHAEVVRPALRFLHQPGFEGPCNEFLQAFDHFKSGEYRDAITDANNAFESTLKAICDARKWEYDKRARASDLLKAVRSKSLFPTYLDNSFDQLASTLSSGLPEIRNNEGSHGQGAKLTETPEYVAAYALHLAASSILFLAECYKARGK